MSDDEVHVWAASLDQPVDTASLSASEREWADAVLRPQEGCRRRAGRAILRDILHRYGGPAPARLEFGRGPYGKPMLLGPGPRFNLSHCEGEMMLAVRQGAEVGVDLDRLDRLDGDWRGVARTSFSPDERAALARQDEADQAQSAMRLWVAKEAYAKSRGTGYARGFKAFSLCLDDRSPRLAQDDGDPGAPARTWLVSLPVAAPMAAALAGEGRVPAIRLWRYGTERD